jgi:hypothetical protein
VYFLSLHVYNQSFLSCDRNVVLVHGNVVLDSVINYHGIIDSGGVLQWGGNCGEHFKESRQDSRFVTSVTVSHQVWSKSPIYLW